jgi:Tfp pilus assembly protein PilO
MNALVRRAIQEHRATVVPMAIIAVLNLLAYIAVVRPLALKSSGASERAAAAERTLRAAERDMAAADALVTGKARADEELDAFYRKVLPADMTAARRMTYASLPALARRTGVDYEARSTDIETVDRDGRLARMAIRMTLQGAYEDLRQFIYGLESAHDFVIIDDVTLVENSADEALRLTVNLSTYYRVEPNGR